VKDCQTHAVLLEGRSENGLYPIRLRKTSLRDHHSFTAFLGIKTSSMGWHFRLGHPAYDLVSRIVKNFDLPLSLKNMNKDVICISCQQGKRKRLPFTPSQLVSTQPLQLIHTDVWTSPVFFVSGYKYYVVFIDDFSRFSWIYPLHAKSGVFDQFVKFKLMVENQFSLTIKQVQSDGGGEYNSLQFQSFFTKFGIIHRKSCPHTSQQNGLVERKLRHILETGLTLLAHAHLSNKYWVDAFLTAVYIISRLPTPLLDFQSPFSKLYNKAPDYQGLWVFGCKCYPLLRPHGLHKLEYRSKPCIFLGYHHAGYKCMDPITNKVYLSRHVVFDESTFPAKE
jgi:transposase InsO family protein